MFVFKENNMKLLDQGYGNSGDFMSAKERVWKNPEVKFDYIAYRSYGGLPGRIGGSFNWEIRGTNDLRELMKPGVRGEGYAVFRRKDGERIPTEDIAREYVKSLSPIARAKLILDMLVDFLSKER